VVGGFGGVVGGGCGGVFGGGGGCGCVSGEDYEEWGGEVGGGVVEKVGGHLIMVTRWVFDDVSAEKCGGGESGRALRAREAGSSLRSE
jgi:hypothetical protein